MVVVCNATRRGVGAGKAELGKPAHVRCACVCGGGGEEWRAGSCVAENAARRQWWLPSGRWSIGTRGRRGGATACTAHMADAQMDVGWAPHRKHGRRESNGGPTSCSELPVRIVLRYFSWSTHGRTWAYPDRPHQGVRHVRRWLACKPVSWHGHLHATPTCECYDLHVAPGPGLTRVAAVTARL